MHGSDSSGHVTVDSSAAASHSWVHPGKVSSHTFVVQLHPWLNVVKVTYTRGTQAQGNCMELMTTMHSLANPLPTDEIKK